MATMTYRCPIEPDRCPPREEWGYCDTHTYPYEQVRTTLNAPEPATTAAPPAAPPPAAPTRVQHGPAPVAELTLKVLGATLVPPRHGELVLGRDEPPLSQLPGMAELTMVSRCHARVYQQSGRLWVADSRSTNGTFLDGVPVIEPMALRPGQQLRLGKAGGPTLTVCSTDDDLDEFGLPR